MPPSCLLWLPLFILLISELLSKSLASSASLDSPIQLSSIEEERPANTPVANLRDELAKRGLTVGDKSTFAFYNNRVPIRKLFYLKKNTGELLTRIRIDRDFLCRSQDLCCPNPDRQHSTACQLKFPVKIRESDEKLYLKLFVLDLVDLNDNTPKFPSNKIHRKVMENLLPGKQIPLPLAEDPDAGTYGVVAYELTELDSSRPPFKIVTQSTDGRISQLSLVTLRSLNREVTPYYLINISARDGDYKKDILLVNITVGDDNDCTPVFLNKTFVIRVKENISPGSIICRVKANDCDVGENGRITYSLNPSRSNVKSMFSISSELGEVTLNSPLDHENKIQYKIRVEARDNGQSQGRSAKMEFTVIVEDINDSRPRITVNPETDSGRVEIPENAKPNYVVATVDVFDPDEGLNGRVYCELKVTGDQVFHLGELGAEGAYKIISTMSFDREKRETYDGLIKCLDSGQPQQNSEKRFTVTVLDKNDNSPIFHPAAYTFSIFENNKPNQIIGQVKANDIDTGSNGRIIYELDHPNSEFVKINPATGMISSAVSFDRENIDRFQVKVIARDGGKESLSATATVTVVINDVNDNSPKFGTNSSPLRLLIPEDTPVNTIIAKLNASDADAGQNGKVEFHLVNMTHFFRLSRDGRLSVQKALDRETRAHFRFLIEARDRGTHSRMSSALLLIDVLDINDNAPRFIFPSDNSEFYSVNISLDFVPGKTITRIVAADLDTDDNSAIRYRIVPQNESFPSSPSLATIYQQQAADIFILEEISGELKLNRRLDGKQLSFMLKIEARDMGEPSLSSTRLLIIKVLPVSTGHRKINFDNRSVPGIVVILVAGLAVLVLVVLLLLIVFLVNRRLLSARTANGGRSGHKNPDHSPPNYDEIVLDHKQLGRSSSADLISRQPMLTDSTSLMTLSGKQIATLQRDRTLSRRDQQLIDSQENAALLLKMKQFSSSQGHRLCPDECSTPSSLAHYQNECPDNENEKYSAYLPYHRRTNTGKEDICGGDSRLATIVGGGGGGGKAGGVSTYYQLHRGGVATLQPSRPTQGGAPLNCGGVNTMTRDSEASDPGGSTYTSLATGKPISALDDNGRRGSDPPLKKPIGGSAPFPNRTLRYPYDDISHV